MRYAPIENFSAYRVSDEGWVESQWSRGCFHDQAPGPLAKWNRLQQAGRDDGYKRVDLRDGKGGRRAEYVHRLVIEAFVGPKPFPDAVVRHLDGNSRNNHATNLAWGTHADNENDKKRHGTWEHRYNGKLTGHDRSEICRRYLLKERQDNLAKEFGVSRPTITRLINGSTWKNIK